MTLKRKTFLVLAALCLTLIAGGLSFYSFYVLGEFREIEQDNVRSDIRRVNESFLAAKEQLRVTAVDWAQWDELYDMMAKPEKSQLESWEKYEAYQVLQITHNFFIDRNKKVVFGVEVDHQARKVFPAGGDSAFAAQLIAIDEIFAFKGEIPSTAFFARIGSGTFIVAASPILSTSSNGESRGTMILTKRIDHVYLEKMEVQTQLSLTSINPRDAERFFNTDELHTLLTDHLIKAEGINKIDAYITLKNYLNEPIRYVKISEPRPVFMQGLVTLKWFFGFWLIASALSLAMATILMDKLVISRLALICDRLNTIKQNKKLGEQIMDTSSDELGKLAHNLNDMLSSLSETYSELSHARDAAEAANQAKSDFIAKVSHELRTPLHSILGLVRIIRKRTTDESNRSHLGMVRDSAIGLLGVVNDILDFSQSEVGTLSVNAEPIQLRNAVRNALRIVSPRVFERADRNPLELVANVDEAVPEMVMGDSNRISQILVNLIGNSIKFTKEGYIALSVRQVMSRDRGLIVEMSVEDTGSGIPKNKLSTIFEPFKQVDDSASRQHQGTGLGLTIVKQLVDAMDGTIRVESRVGKGSTFIIELPLMEVGESHGIGTPLERNGAVWVINNSALETELIAQAFRSYDLHVVSHSTSSLRTLDISDIDMRKISYLVVSGNAMISHRAWMLLQTFVEVKGSNNALVSLSPHELTYREQLRVLGVSNIILAPHIAEETVRVFTGKFQENFNGHDDFIDVTPTSKEKLEILIADDLVTNQIVLRCMLSDMGHSVTTVNNGQELIGALAPQLGMRKKGHQDRDFDLVLTDVQMPVVDGVSAVQRIRQIEDELDIPLDERLPILLVTTHVLAEEQLRIHGAGANGIITKPIDIKELEVTIENLVKSTGESPSPSTSLPLSSEQDIQGMMRGIDYILSAVKDIELRIRQETMVSHPHIGCRTLVDTKSLKERIAHDQSRFTIVLDSYELTLSALIENLSNAIEQRHTKELETHTYSLEGCFKELGCQPGLQTVAEVILLLRNNQAEAARIKAQDLLPIIQKAHQVVAEALNRCRV